MKVFERLYTDIEILIVKVKKKSATYDGWKQNLCRMKQNPSVWISEWSLKPLERGEKQRNISIYLNINSGFGYSESVLEIAFRVSPFWNSVTSCEFASFILVYQKLSLILKFLTKVVLEKAFETDFLGSPHLFISET